MNNILPEWAHTIIIDAFAVQVLLVGLASWVYQILPVPKAGANSWYLIFYGIVERISMSGRKQWSVPDRIESRTVVQQIDSTATAAQEKKEVSQ